VRVGPDEEAADRRAAGFERAARLGRRARRRERGAERVRGVRALTEIGSDDRDGRAERFSGPAGVRLEPGEVGEAAVVPRVEVRRGDEGGERGGVGLHLAAEGEGEGLGGGGEALLEGGAVVPGHAPRGGGADGERGEQDGEDEGREVRPQAAALRRGGLGRYPHPLSPRGAASPGAA
jgi:hypothetical protein